MNSRARSILLRIVGAFATLSAQAAYAGEVPTNRMVVVGWNQRGEDSGWIRAVSADQPWGYLANPLEVGRDPFLRSAFGRLYVLNADDNAVRVVNPQTFSIEQTFPIGSSAPPIDVAVVSPATAYLTTPDSAILTRLDLATGGVTPVLDLGDLAQPGDVPELGTMNVHDGRLFVQIRHLDRDDALSPSSVAVVDLATEQLVDADPAAPGLQPIALAGTAPKGKMQLVPETGRLWVNASGGFFDAGGIESVNLTTLQSEGLAINEADDETGADLNAFVLTDPDQGYLTYSTDLLASSHLHHFTTAGDVDPTELHVAVDYITPAIEFDALTNTIFLPSGGFDADGLHVFDVATGQQLTANPIATGGPPTDVILIPEPAGSLVVILAAAGILLARVNRRRVHRG